MPLAVAEYLRHLATRCSRMSRDCTDQVTGKELVQISVELVEKAEILESYFSIAEPSGKADELLSSDIISVSDDDESS
jgi:hypothetical protein